jgi:hypothetical protein
MKKIYLFIFIGIVALVMIVVSFMGFDPKVDTWSSIFAGAAVGLLILRLPSLIAYLKSRKQNNAK